MKNALKGLHGRLPNKMHYWPIALCANDVTKFISGPCYESDKKPDPYEFLWESHVHLQIHVVFEDFLSSKETKSSLFSITCILKIIDVCQGNVKHEKNYTDE